MDYSRSLLILSTAFRVNNECIKINMMTIHMMIDGTFFLNCVLSVLIDPYMAVTLRNRFPD